MKLKGDTKINRGERWHEMAETEPLGKSFLIFSAAMVSILMLVFLLGCSPAYGDDGPDQTPLVNGPDISQGDSFASVSDTVDGNYLKIEQAKKSIAKMHVLKAKACKAMDNANRFSRMEKFAKAKNKVKKANGYLKKLKSECKYVKGLKAGKKYNRKANQIVSSVLDRFEACKDVYDTAKTQKRMNDIYADRAYSLRFNGVMDSGGWHYTWYSEHVLPGWGLDIPGRHVGLAEMIMDRDGYICVASSSLSKGTVLETPFGMAKVYDTGCPYGTIDVYTSW